MLGIVQRGAEQMAVIGFLLIEYAIIGFIIFVTGWNLSLKDKILMMIGFIFFLTTLTLGVGMLSGWG